MDQNRIPIEEPSLLFFNSSFSKTSPTTSPLQMCQHHQRTPPYASVLAFSQLFFKGLSLISPRNSILATSQSWIARVALDDRYENKFAPLDSTAIYPKPGHKLLYTPMIGEMKCPIGYTFALRISFHLLHR
jgi:hypothetical protein